MQNDILWFLSNSFLSKNLLKLKVKHTIICVITFLGYFFIPFNCLRVFKRPRDFVFIIWIKIKKKYLDKVTIYTLYRLCYQQEIININQNRWFDPLPVISEAENYMLCIFMNNRKSSAVPRSSCTHYSSFPLIMKNNSLLHVQIMYSTYCGITRWVQLMDRFFLFSLMSLMLRFGKKDIPNTLAN